MQVVKAGTYAERPDDPVRDGYDFDGWYTDPGCGRPFDFGTQVTGHMTLYAKWVPSSGGGGEGDAGDGGSDGPDGAGSGYATLFSGSMVGIGIVGLAVNSRRMRPNGAVSILSLAMFMAGMGSLVLGLDIPAMLKEAMA